MTDREQIRRIGVCFNDYEPFYWEADKESQRGCPACGVDDDTPHGFFVDEAELEQAERKQRDAEQVALYWQGHHAQAERELAAERVLGVSDKITGWYDVEARVKELEAELEQAERERDYYFEMARDEGRRADDLDEEVRELIVVANEARSFHEKLWNPWRSGRTSAIFADSVVIAYGKLRRALSAWENTTAVEETSG